MQDTTVKIAHRKVEIKYLETSHGIYVKLVKPIYCINVERAFGLGCACAGFDPNKIVYYPNYKQEFASFREAFDAL
jgi:hypothetical protein